MTFPPGESWIMLTPSLNQRGFPVELVALKIYSNIKRYVCAPATSIPVVVTFAAISSLPSNQCSKCVFLDLCPSYFIYSMSLLSFFSAVMLSQYRQSRSVPSLSPGRIKSRSTPFGCFCYISDTYFHVHRTL